MTPFQRATGIKPTCQDFERLKSGGPLSCRIYGDSFLDPNGQHVVICYGADGTIINHKINGVTISEQPR